MNHYESLRIVQIAYIVRDLDEAIERWHAAFSLGPFIVNRHMKFEHSTYRGTASPLDISAAFVQSGDLQIELLCQHDSQPSAFRDMYAEGEEGLHHVAALPEDYARSIAAYQDRGFAVAAEIAMANGLGAAFIDTRDTWGHMLEVYRDNGGLRAFYRLVANAARDWDGRTLIVDINELSA
jgi:catechol 2,3-dioxygenase-like lactoylglutathione lyase family enzyme